MTATAKKFWGKHSDKLKPPKNPNDVEQVFIHYEKEAEKFLATVMDGKHPRPGWEVIAVDTEFYWLDDEEAKTAKYPVELYFFQFSNGRVTVCVDGPNTVEAEGREGDPVAVLRPMIESARVKKAYATLDADADVLEARGYTLRGFHGDTEVMDWLHDENRLKHGLKDCAADHCRFYMKEYGDTFGYFPLKKDGTPYKKRTVPSMREICWGKERFPYLPYTGAEYRKIARDYAVKDPLGTILVFNHLKAKLEEEGLWEVYENVERPFGETLRQMGKRGVCIDRDAMKDVAWQIYRNKQRLLHIIRADTGQEDFNPASGPQVAKLFGETLKLPVVSWNQRGNKKTPSYDDYALTRYAAEGVEVAEWIQRYRRETKLDGTFVSGLIKKLREEVSKVGDEVKKIWAVFTRFKHTGTVTGRISSRDPNLQNIPSRKEKDPYKLRRFFVPRPGKVFIVADYSQIELFILAQYSRDPRMIQAFQRGEDIHMITSSDMFGIPLPKEPTLWDRAHPDYARWKADCAKWKEDNASARVLGKVLNFGIAYGKTAYGLAQDNDDLTEEEAERWLQAYYKRYKGTREWLRAKIEECRDKGYVTTVGGRLRRIPEINEYGGRDWESKKKASRARKHAENQAVNTPIQGTAGDIIKCAMNMIEANERLAELDCKMLLQVHDELVFEVPPEAAEEAKAIIRKLMLTPFGKDDPFGRYFFKDINIDVSIGVGSSWAEAKH